ncbi:hypothetical protein [Hoyosella altamirensis]|uniref:Transmembrane protein n=1 Tax=Hoyosella altamirensis TaxID=616997 RepID=A0A839RR34_9ACTN|nr:hypothetical protein [Hoyosella altamirensis]MBB3038779.1 hypothetical protein [Hoyosella altamirensis]
MTRDVEKRFYDPPTFRKAATYATVVIVLALGSMGVLLLWAAPESGGVAGNLLTFGPAAILLLGGIGAFVQTYRVWRRGGTWPLWQGAGWFLLVLFFAYAALSSMALTSR